MATERVLLPSAVTPTHYELSLIPDFSTFKFAGSSIVDLTVNEETSSITFNGLDIEVSAASVTVGDKTIASKDITLDAENETITVVLESVLSKGDAKLNLLFTGELNDKLAGFYRSSYEHEGETKWLATTQFEPADARRAFPCWDEPAVKAQFTISLTFPADMIALSNMPVESESTEDDVKTVKFGKTPIMSTYLVAFCIGHFEFIETTTSEGIKFRVWTTPGKKEMGSFALEVGAKVITYFGEYYGIPFPLPKQDFLAVPDFSAGAMENWGLVTYRETALLCDTEGASVASKSRIAYVVSHELAHQWFGNLVTMEWWKELWLNEGFATFVGSQAVAKFFPEWDIWTQFISDYIFRALQVDSLRNSHPIEVDISKARQIDEIFDAVSYCKGASVIRMIENYLGEADFKRGLNLYLEKFKYGNATTQDLWASLTDGSGKPVKELMDNWVQKVGYPIVSVEQGDTKGQFKVSQKRFFAAGAPTPEEDETVWNISIGVCSKSHPEIKYVSLKTKTGVVEVDIDEDDEWVKFNAGQSGFYRVAYSAPLSERLGVAIKEKQLSAADRLGIQNDAFALSKAGLIPLSQTLALIQFYVEEDDYTVWSDLSANLGAVGTLLSGTAVDANLDSYTLALYSSIKKLGWDPVEGESDLHKRLRAVVLSQLSNHGDAAVVAEAKKRFAQYVEDPSSLANDLHGVVFKTVMRNGGKTEYDSMKKIYLAATQPENRIRALQCLGFSTQEVVILEALEYALSDEVRTQDMFYLIWTCASTSAGRVLAWNFVKTRWDDILAKLGGGMGLVGRIISFTTKDGNTTEWADDVEAFFETHHADSTERTIAQSLESIRANAAYLTRNLEDVSAFLTTNYAVKQ
eukprot:TRINITY_DN1435_c0_g1_i1.p1 TRINITY_DN1435_c0_g1~~TRINITY_DN1435_c0_g1_i1.p1  ORF type:complete len:863 (-),score=234.42 TRINITY_DN1435_c0_g1_i1:89-2677(-)